MNKLNYWIALTKFFWIALSDLFLLNLSKYSPIRKSKFILYNGYSNDLLKDLSLNIGILVVKFKSKELKNVTPKPVPIRGDLNTELFPVFIILYNKPEA